jgi:hypothetical protein
MPFFALSLSTKSSLPFGFTALFLSASCLPGSLLGNLSYRLHKSRVVKVEDSTLAAVAARSQLFLHDRKKQILQATMVFVVK